MTLSEEDDAFVSQRLRGRLDESNLLDVYGPLVEHDELRDWMIRLSASWSSFSSEETPERFEDTRVCKQLVRLYGSRFLKELLYGGNNVGLAYLLGEEEPDVESVEDSIPIQKIQRSIHNHGMPYYLWIKSPPKTAKTGTAVSYVHFAEPMYGYDDLTLIGNVPSLERIDHAVTCHEEFVAALEASTYPIALMFDEAADFLDARNNRSYVSGEFMPEFRRTGKEDTVMCIFISHGKDLHPMIREQVTEVVVKEARDEFVVYDGWSEQLDKPVGEKYPVSGVPVPPYSYDPDDGSYFSTP